MSGALLTIDTSGGEARLELHAREIEARVERMRPVIANALAWQLRMLAPRRTGRLRAHVRALVLGQTIRIGVFDVPYARAQDRGAYIVASGVDERYHARRGSKGTHVEGGAKALRLHGGHPVRWVRIPAQHYMRKAIAIAPRTIDVTFEVLFENLDRPASATIGAH